MKATLEFNLPEESEEHLRAVHATDWYLVAWNMHQYLWKLNHEGHTTTTQADLDYLNNLVSDYGLTL
jgi:hypothetical protein